MPDLVFVSIQWCAEQLWIVSTTMNIRDAWMGLYGGIDYGHSWESPEKREAMFVVDDVVQAKNLPELLELDYIL